MRAYLIAYLIFSVPLFIACGVAVYKALKNG